MSTATAPVIGRYGVASSDLSPILDLVAREMARKHTAFYNIGFSEAKALFRQKLARKWSHTIARGWATLLLDRLRDFVVVPSSAGGNSSFEFLSSTLRAWRSVPLWTATITLITSMATLGHVRLISFVDVVCAALLFFSTCEPSNSGPSGPKVAIHVPAGITREVLRIHFTRYLRGIYVGITCGIYTVTSSNIR